MERNQGLSQGIMPKKFRHVISRATLRVRVSRLGNSRRHRFWFFQVHFLAWILHQHHFTS